MNNTYKYLNLGPLLLKKDFLNLTIKVVPITMITESEKMEMKKFDPPPKICHFLPRPSFGFPQWLFKVIPSPLSNFLEISLPQPLHRGGKETMVYICTICSKSG